MREVHFLTEETKETGLVDPLGPTEEELEELVDTQPGSSSCDGCGHGLQNLWRAILGCLF